MSQPPIRFNIPDIKFRVLIVGRANAGKTSILQRVCNTTENPKVYRRVDGKGRREEIQLNPTTERGDHNIEDELQFTSHTGYVFHDSCGFEAGNEEELRKVQEFVRKKATARKLRDRLHAIWYCVPMDNCRPGPDMKFFGEICPDKNVPVIAMFTKYEQFELDVEMNLEDLMGDVELTPEKLIYEAEKIFQEQYLNVIKIHSPRFVRLKTEWCLCLYCIAMENAADMHQNGESCNALVVETGAALSTEVVTLMLLAVQRGNLRQASSWQ